MSTFGEVKKRGGRKRAITDNIGRQSADCPYIWASAAAQGYPISPDISVIALFLPILFRPPDMSTDGGIFNGRTYT